MPTRARTFAGGILAAALIVVGPDVQAQAPAAAMFDAAAKRAVITQAAAGLRGDYIFPEVGARAAEKIEAALAAGAYDSGPSRPWVRSSR